VIDPRGLNVKDWCDLTALDLGQLVTVPTLLSEHDWQRWAISVSSSTKISQFHPPDPRHFGDWREWAMRFIQAVPL